MSDGRSPIDQIAFLSRSESRVRVLEQLRSNGPMTQREFREQLDTSRSTVARTLSQLEEHGWLSQTGDTYTLTPTGRLVSEQFLSLVESLRMAEELAPFLDWFPYAEYPLDLDCLTDAEITPSTDADPYAPGRKQTEFIDEQESIRFFLPSIELEGARTAHEQIMDGDLSAEFVVSAAVADRIVTGEFATLFRAEIETGRMEIYAVDGNLPFYLGLGEDATVQLGVEDGDGFPRALLEVENESLRMWAEGVYDEHLARAEFMPRAAFADSSS